MFIWFTRIIVYPGQWHFMPLCLNSPSFATWKCYVIIFACSISITPLNKAGGLASEMKQSSIHASPRECLRVATHPALAAMLWHPTYVAFVHHVQTIKYTCAYYPFYRGNILLKIFFSLNRIKTNILCWSPAIAGEYYPSTWFDVSIVIETPYIAAADGLQKSASHPLHDHLRINVTVG